ncbi:pentatricopeptide repeat (PPR) superfamily protein [Wolffia australiana]
MHSLRGRKLLHSLYRNRHFSKSEGQTLPQKSHPLARWSLHKPWLIPFIKSCVSLSQLRQLHALILLSAVGRDPAISVAFLSRAAALPSNNSNALDYIRRVFEAVHKPFTPHYNAIIRAYVHSSSPEEAFSLFMAMRRRKIRADPASFTFVLKACTRTRLLLGGVQLHGLIIRDGHQPDSLLTTSLMDLYGSCGCTLEAELLFAGMADRDLVSWNVLVSCYTHNGRSKDALVLFDLMQDPRYGMEPDMVTCLLLLQTCANLSAFQFGERVRKFAEDRGYGRAPNLRNSLVTMYAKCGAMEKALDVFRATPCKSVVSWSAIISGLAMNGRAEEALEAFSAMKRAGIAPDEQTITGVLSACSHAGLIDEGLRLFNSMAAELRVAPNLHHYGCAVDLMARAGRLEQAYGLIVNSPQIKPDAKIWRTLLNGCRNHRQSELGERVLLHLDELKAREAGDMVLLLNIYAAAGDWEKVAELRKTMKEKKIQTQPGCSSIEVAGRVHEFQVEDGAHPRKREIYEMLGEVEKQLKIAGRAARLEAELHWCGEEEREVALSFHSEKLAIAFGLLSTKPCETIRVAKNLRTCADCHDFAKAVSAVYNRRLVIRDRSRFHHFREGRCSCNDYW